jgi:hypothetical protein
VKRVRDSVRVSAPHQIFSIGRPGGYEIFVPG